MTVGKPYSMSGRAAASLLICLNRWVMTCTASSQQRLWRVFRCRVRIKFSAWLYSGRPVRNDSFDVITIWHVLEHTEDPCFVLGKLRSLLKPQGVLVVEVPNIEAICQSPKSTFHEAHLFNFNLDTYARWARNRDWLRIVICFRMMRATSRCFFVKLRPTR